MKSIIFESIELTRGDLMERKSDLPVNEIGIYDFKSTSMNTDEMHKAHLIIFKDGEQTKELKKVYHSR